MAGITQLFKSAPSSWPEDLAWVPIETLEQHHPQRAPPLPTTPDATDPTRPCFLQYTSGSTSAPKGVVISHGNLTHNLSIISAELDTSPDIVEVGEERVGPFGYLLAAPATVPWRLNLFWTH